MRHCQHSGDEVSPKLLPSLQGSVHILCRLAIELNMKQQRSYSDSLFHAASFSLKVQNSEPTAMLTAQRYPAMDVLSRVLLYRVSRHIFLLPPTPSAQLPGIPPTTNNPSVVLLRLIFLLTTVAAV